MHRGTILVVEDDRKVQNLICAALGAEGYPYLLASDGADGLSLAASRQPDILLLDLGLPDLDGVEVIRRIRRWSQMPILVLSARSEDSDKITALDAGADDYLTKPFSVAELLARIRTTQRRLDCQEQPRSDAVFHNGPLEIDYAAGCAFLKGEPLRLTPTEYRLLCLLARNTGRVLTHTFLTEQLWGMSLDSELASLRVHMATLRKKLEKASDSPLIQTQIGVGYRMVKVD